jgi:phosphoglycerate dehydrogenase-like enzyme
MLRIAILDDFPDIATGLADWGSISGAQVTAFTNHVTGVDELAERLAGFDVVQMMRERTPIPAALMERLPSLKLLSGTGRRAPHVDMEAASRLGIVVTGTPGASDSTPELVWGLIIGLMRHIPWEDRQLRAGHWQTRMGTGLAGKTLGILGMGNIGTKTAAHARAFNMEVIAWGPTLTPERAAASGADYVAWDELFKRADVLTIHVPLTDLSRGWVGERELGLMKPTAYLINTSRGPIVQEGPLLATLKAGRIAGAALDVFDAEPLPAGHPLLGLENVVLTPHLGYTTLEGLGRFYEGAVENIRAWAAGAPTNVMNEAALANMRRP